MATPHVKTWQMSLNNFIPISDTLTEKTALLNGFVNGLLGVAQNPMTVSGSSNAITAGMDGVNRWLTHPSINNNYWIVLRDAQIAPKFEILLDIQSFTGDHSIAVFVSPGAGFGTVNGGTNGTITTPPTATDQVSIGTIGFGTGLITSLPLRFYLWRSTDGKFTIFLVKNLMGFGNGGGACMLWFWGAPINTPALWVNPVVWRFGQASSAGAATNVNSLSDIGGHFNGQICTNITMVDSMTDGNTAPYPYASSLDGPGVFTAGQLPLFIPTVQTPASFTHKGGKIGVLPDMLYVPGSLAQSDNVRGAQAVAPATPPYIWSAYQTHSNTGQALLLLPHDNTPPKRSQITNA